MYTKIELTSPMLYIVPVQWSDSQAGQDRTMSFSVPHRPPLKSSPTSRDLSTWHSPEDRSAAAWGVGWIWKALTAVTGQTIWIQYTEIQSWCQKAAFCALNGMILSPSLAPRTLLSSPSLIQNEAVVIHFSILNLTRVSIHNRPAGA